MTMEALVLPPQVLPAAQFASLASGYGSADAIATIVSGQVAKHRLLIRAVVDLLREHPAVDQDELRADLELLIGAEQRHPQQVLQVLAAPHVAVWAIAQLARPATGGSQAPEFSPADVHQGLRLVVLAAAIRAGMAFRATWTSVDGRLSLPTLGTAVGLGTGPVRLLSDGATVTCAGTRATVRFSAPSLDSIGSRSPSRAESGSPPDRVAWLPVRIAGGTAGVPAVRVEDVDPNRDCYGIPPRRRLDNADYERLHRTWMAAWQSIERKHSMHLAAAKQIVREIIPLDAGRDAGAVSAASRHAFGAIALTPPDTVDTMVELIIHEMQHMKLGAVLDLIDLHHQGGSDTYYAPWRPDPRPAGALLQGCYAHLGVADVWRHRCQETDRPTIWFEFALWRLLLADGLRELLGTGELTDLGRRFAQGMMGTLEAWRELRAPANVDRIAGDVALAYRARWALTCQNPDPAAVEMVVEAWHCGLPCPRVPGSLPARPPSPGRPHDVRLATAARALLGREETSSGEAGPEPVSDWPEAMLLAGRYGAARKGYVDAIHESDDIDDWVGLVVAVQRPITPAGALLLSRPDVVRYAWFQVNQNYSGPAGFVDPFNLAHWMAAG